MIPTKRLRRTVAALALPAALLFTAACGSDEDGGSGSSGSSDSASSGPVASVSGQPGEQPKITVEDGAGVGAETVSRVLREGDGAKVDEGDFLRMDVLARFVENDAELLNTWSSSQNAQEGEGSGGEESNAGGSEDLRQQIVSQAGVESYLPKAVTEPLIGSPVGSRVQIEGRAAEIFGESVAQQYQLSEDEGVVWVIDVVGAVTVDAKAEAEGEQAPVEEGMPEVEAGGQKPATITIPEGQDPPKELQEQVLIEGEGPEVEAGQALAVQYTGVTWADGKKFDSSWDRDSASAFQIGTGSVVPGWDEGLVGKHVGDRVLLVLPPDKGYGEEGTEGIPGGSTLVFVVDILGAA
ncbi:FKBP-type peptidyl-prolyl cis-trans isomerase [Streptomyces sp. 6N223]|uniref:FKBP-type peptidyl-prolyl cis-trans isomerase n=1 Tax=Streptomyces sp. 6N223 TaxID=3457412 RepID=UPI003FD3751D